MIADWISWLPDLLRGLLSSVLVAVLAIVFGYPAGILLALATDARHRALRWTTVAVVEVLRGLPALVLVYVLYFGLVTIELRLSAVVALLVALSLAGAGYSTEIFRAGFNSVPRQTLEAGVALGLSGGQRLIHIVLPQALRVSTPPLVSLGIILFHASALGFAIGMSELLGRAYQIGSVTFNYLSVLGLAGVLYAAVSIAGSRYVNSRSQDHASIPTTPRVSQS